MPNQTSGPAADGVDSTHMEQRRNKMFATETQQLPIVLDFSDGARQVMVSPQDQDRFVTTCEQAAEACKQAYNLRLWREQFNKMLFDLREWVEGLSSKIRACYVAPRDGSLMIFFVPATDRFDFELDEDMTDLDIHLATKYPLCRCEVLQVPGKTPETLGTFLDPTEALQIYGNDARARGEVEAQS